ncbi:MAG: efflux RND transporter periplasmic adaptor subunit [Rikenellaceae bacterium]
MNGRKTFMGVALLVSLSVMSSCGNSSSSQAQQSTKSYKTLNLTLSSADLQQKYTASIQGEQFVDIRPQVSGVITQILIEEGARIKAGQTLFIIDQAPYKAALDVASANVKSAEASVETAKINAKSGEELFRESVISKAELSVLKNSLAIAEAALALAVAQESSAKNDLSYTVIKSPVDGVAGMISYRVGALVSSSITDPLVSVSDNNNMYAYFSMSESQILTMAQGGDPTQSLIEQMPEVELILNNGTRYSHKGDVDAISGVVNRSTGAVSIRATFPNPERLLRDGGSGTVIVPTHQDSVIVIPKVATYELQNKIFAYRVIDGKASSAEITIYPLDNGQEYIVTSGLNVGDRIIAEGAGLVREGTSVEN